MNGAHSLGMSILDSISLSELCQIYHVVRLYLLMVMKVTVFGIPGEELKGVHSARELVGGITGTQTSASLHRT
uniref:NADPH:adrenodoxin oxidoreductase, mitochondrial isoform X1 n=1 Tax=Tanacetum cinerariifolium TaxID=118510 RepID=A0A699KG52_TANCI|nr:NADPH:adrenodoxin oxidoreductase, mitochondrial isoform X1 [Tanacetum cinerariifolium]